MKVAIHGLGYVGVVTAACLAADGHRVVGVDVNPAKVDDVSIGRSPITEPGVDELLAQAVDRGDLWATTKTSQAVQWSDVSLISVGTPPTSAGDVDLRHVDTVVTEIASAMRQYDALQPVILRSTVPPGTLDACRDTVSEILGRAAPTMVFNPEFLREGSAIADYRQPAYTVVGCHEQAGEDLLRALYIGVSAPFVTMAPREAELVKYVSNAWHATKISFANEVGRIAQSAGVDGSTVMDTIVRDRKLNVSPAYLRPGFAYGGSCLPKDVAGLVAQARERNVRVPLLESLDATNAEQVNTAVDDILSSGAASVAILGLAFKPDTDDLRSSPAVDVVKRLLGEGVEVRIWDPCVNAENLIGANLDYLRSRLRHFEQLLAPDSAAAVQDADLVVATHGDAATLEVLEGLPEHTPVVDLAGAMRKRANGRAPAPPAAQATAGNGRRALADRA